MSTDTLLPTVAAPSSVAGLFIESFIESLRAVGYASRTVHKKRRAATSFLEWLLREEVAAVDADESHAAAFLDRGSVGRSRSRSTVERAAVRSFLEHLRGIVGAASRAPARPASASAVLEKRYEDYLRHERGLSERSAQVYLPHVRDFVESSGVAGDTASPAALVAHVVRDFLLDRVRNRSGGYARLLAAALRSFLRFLFLRGETALDLSIAVPTVRRRGLVPVHAFLSPDQVEQILSATDRTTSRGRRDHAILLLLARLGLRAGEVVRLELDDIHWRTAEVLVRGKGRALDRLPLLSDVGEALSVYLQQDRGPSTSRRVFLRMHAPRGALTGPAAIGHVVRIALARAGQASSSRGAAHLFRHSLATRMIRHGASLAEISEILRHRSQSTTEIYAKVAFESLRSVARPWPGTEGGR